MGTHGDPPTPASAARPGAWQASCSAPGQPADLLQPSGTINPGGRIVGDRYVMALRGYPPELRGDGRSPWSRLSGAALFCGDLLTGVITEDPAGRGARVYGGAAGLRVAP